MMEKLNLSVKKILFIFLLGLNVISAKSQVHEIINGDTTVMEQYIYFDFGHGLNEDWDTHYMPENLQDGTWKVYFTEKKEQLRFLANYKFNVKHGKWVEWDKDGNKIYSALYNLGNVLRDTSWYNDNNTVAIRYLDYQNSYFTASIFENGKRKFKSVFSNKTQTDTNWYESGVLRSVEFAHELKIVSTITYLNELDWMEAQSDEYGADWISSLFFEDSKIYLRDSTLYWNEQGKLEQKDIYNYKKMKIIEEKY